MLSSTYSYLSALFDIRVLKEQLRLQHYPNPSPFFTSVSVYFLSSQWTSGMKASES